MNKIQLTDEYLMLDVSSGNLDALGPLFEKYHVDFLTISSVDAATKKSARILHKMCFKELSSIVIHFGKIRFSDPGCTK
jgi:hypothetical protein